jgi:molybdate transport system ATP-binding protein
MNGLDARLRVERGSFRLDLALTAAPGTTVALLGPNGAGKSTAVMALAGLLAITEGRIAIAGTVVDDPAAGVFVPPEHRRVGIVFQDYLLFPHLSALENVAFGLRSRGMSRIEARRRATDWLDRLGLAGSIHHRPGELSGGQAQRVALARALATEPDLLLLDEPLSALDVTTRVELRRVLMEHLDAFPGPRVLITHDPTEAFLMADEIHIIEGGSSTQSGTAQEIRLRPRTRYAADLAGANLVSGIAGDGVVEVDGHPLHIADQAMSGPVLATIRPTAITVHRLRPEGSPRNAWPTTIELIEHLGERTRVRTGGPLPLTAEITDSAARELALEPGSPVWISIKATEIGVEQE